MNPDTEWGRIRAELDIANLVYTCARATDQRDEAAFAQCYTEDGEFHRSGKVFRGSTEIAHSLRERKASLQRRHVFTNVQVQLQGTDQAQGQSYCLVYDKDEAAEAGLPPIVADIQDEYLRVNGQWKIQRRVVRRSFI
ncbi:nuclear transport factor 2 family protein [Comamonas sp. J-3]|jgi:uncharacterized protein (TIGR02246 family)|uniref:nuclear transport factor 2 family protein n=1 Tax=Comamonas trifloxystrobinivorans TaxID=3350256 RepID=UPI003729DA69